MPAWGIASGKGVLNPQGIADLVAYVESIVTTPDKAQADAQKKSDEMRSDAERPRGAGRRGQVGRRRHCRPRQPPRTAAEGADVEADRVPAVDHRCRRVVADHHAVRADGQVLFMTDNCARCRTRGWSYFNPLDPQSTPPMGKMGGGAYGPNLTGGDVDGQFPPPTGEAELFGWIADGVPANQQYGIRGISSGRMPHFGAVLTKEQIEMIMDYERSL